jgi:plastocyanin
MIQFAQLLATAVSAMLAAGSTGIALARSLDSALKRRSARGIAPLRLLAAAPALALVVAACAGTVDGLPANTYAPAPSPSASSAMSMSPSASEPAPSAVPAASGSASAAPIPPASAAPTGATLHISAQNIAFDTDHLEAPAGQAFVLEFDNNDPGVPHNVDIRDANGTNVFKGQIITGPAKVSYQVPALAAGSYTFACDVHPDMTGTLAVK